MPFIWEHADWPDLRYDRVRSDEKYRQFLSQKSITDAAFSILDEGSVKRLRAMDLADEMVSNLAIEDEHIDYDSVYSSVSKRLELPFAGNSRSDAYADSICTLTMDAITDSRKLTEERLNGWHRMLFENAAGIKPKTIGGYRTTLEYIIRRQGREIEIVYTAVPQEKVPSEMERLLDFINDDASASLHNPIAMASIASLWFLAIHPYGDGNGRISRAISDHILSKSFKDTMKVFSLSAMILRNRKSYYELLERITGQKESIDITDWVLWNTEMATGAERNALASLRKTMRLTSFMKDLDPAEYNSREIHMLFKLADGSFFGKLTNEKWAKMNKCSSAAALRDIQHLVENGLLIPSGDAGRNAGYYLNPEIGDRYGSTAY
jgi:Fic family protein